VGRIVKFECGAELDYRGMDAFQETFPDDGLVGEEIESFVGLYMVVSWRQNDEKVENYFSQT
jgi:hypothetical protein